MKIVILRDREKKENIRCFGTTDVQLSLEDILRKYRFRWIIENGIKDLVASYYLDEIFGLDPEKVEFEFYCVMVARLSYEYFLKELGGKYYNSVNGNKITLCKMRNLLIEKRNCTIELDHTGNLILTLLDWQKKGTIEDHVSKMLLSLSFRAILFLMLKTKPKLNTRCSDGEKCKGLGLWRPAERSALPARAIVTFSIGFSERVWRVCSSVSRAAKGR
jgi:hypothetical protein